MLRRFRLLTPVLLLCPFLAAAQSESQSQPPPGSKPYTIQANSRVVLTDVTVTDSKGRPVHGLSQSTFRIFDDDKPQTISSFEEHRGTARDVIETGAIERGVYSDDYLLHLPPVLSVVLIDIANLEITEQMYLYYELTKFFERQGAGQPMAIYLRAGGGCFLVQNFTTNRDLLLKALRKAIPRIPPTGREYLSDIDTLSQITAYLSQFPGRKNVIWFSGGSTLFLQEDATPYQDLTLNRDAASFGNATLLQNAEQHDDPARWRRMYDQLEQERIAVYPIDARGLTTGRNPSHAAQDAMMMETAESTGGHAYYNNNGLTEIANYIFSSDTEFYTLTYSPRDFRVDNKWHKVRVALNGRDDQLSYRHGYFADGSPGAAEQPHKGAPRTRMLAGGEQIELPEAHNEPVIFRARVLPSSDPAVISSRKAMVSLPAPPVRKGAVPFSVRYSLPVSELTQQTIHGSPEVVFWIGAIVLNHEGHPVDTHAEQVTITLNTDELRANPSAGLAIDQQLNLKKGDDYLYLAIWDMTSGRIGTVQLPLQVPKSGKPAGNN